MSTQWIEICVTTKLNYLTVYMIKNLKTSSTLTSYSSKRQPTQWCISINLLSHSHGPFSSTRILNAVLSLAMGYFYINVLTVLLQWPVYFFHHWFWKVWCQVLWSIINCYLKDLQYCSFSSFLMIMVVLLRRSSESILFLLTNVPLRCWQKCWFRDSVKYSGNIRLLQGYIREVDSESVAAWLSGVTLTPWEQNRRTSMQVSWPGLFISCGPIGFMID